MTPPPSAGAERRNPLGDPRVADLLHTDRGARQRSSAASGPIRLLPSAVAVPTDEDGLSRLVSWAEQEGVPLIPRGAGTGMPGGNVGSGVVVDLSGFDSVGEVVATDADATIRVGAGAVAARVEEAAAAAGFFLPPLPSSADRCTVGGMVANNAAGARTFRYGATRDWVAELEVVLHGGQRATLRPGSSPESIARLRASLGDPPDLDTATWPKIRKNASGYALDRFLPTGDPVQLLVGSEGTLGIVTGATLRLARLPLARGVALLGLGDEEDLPAVSEAVREVGASALEMLGRRLLEMAALHRDPGTSPVAKDARLLLLVEVEGTPDEVAAALETVRKIARSHGSGTVEARSPEAMRHLWKLRRRASPTIARAAERGLRSAQFIEDSVVPPERVPDYLAGLEDLLGRRTTRAVVFGHAGDGNVHVNPLLDVSRPGWREDAMCMLEETAALVRRLGGTLSGEHGDGRIRAPFLSTIWPEPWLGRFRAVKRMLDPGGVFNPGVIVPLRGQDALDGFHPHASGDAGARD